MDVGDMVRVSHIGGWLSKKRRNIGLIVKVDRSPVSHKIRYCVKLFGGWKVGPVPFMERQLELISESR